MPNPLQPLSLGVPAFFGLNTERQTSLLEPAWATKVDNAVFDSAGRIASRKGYTSAHTQTGKVKAMAEWTTGSILAASNNKLYFDGVDATGTMTTPTDDYWCLVESYGEILGYQDGHVPFEFAGGTCQDQSITTGGAIPTTWSGVALAAYGRVWVMDATKRVLKYSALLDPKNFDGSGTATDATAGYIDLDSVWKNGLDTVQALAAFNGHLVIFGKANILVYSNPILPFSSMALVEDVQGIGCIARDTVHSVGEDIWFLSSSGLRSLGRTVVKDKMPLMDYSKNIRSYFIQHMAPVNDKLSIKATYNEKEGFYLISSPTTGKVFVFDVRAPLEDGSVRVTTWSSNVPTAFLSTKDSDLYFGQSGLIGRYGGYKDNTSAYTFSYVSGWMTLGEDNNGTRYVMPKKLKAILFTGSNNTVTFNWQYDFSTTGFTYSKVLTGVTASEWGIAEYGIGEWGGGGGLSSLTIPMRGYGNLFKVELTSSINGHQLAIQKFDIYAKLGRTS